MNILKYAKAGNLAGVKKCIENGADINVKNHFGETALRIASGEGHLAVVKYLVDNGANINVKDKYWGYNALIIASHYGHLEIVKYLVEKGADINIDGYIALRISSQYGHLEIAEYLRSKGAKKQFKELPIATEFKLLETLYNDDAITEHNLNCINVQIKQAKDIILYEPKMYKCSCGNIQETPNVCNACGEKLK